ncbi:hypothetical protein [Kitasatospora sp. NPDC057223]|uniref:hypothetical protein n=1 Tax=Kitasatospora sp. NPDC057223 TaxID=3346055 RepID=UPI00363669AF
MRITGFTNRCCGVRDVRRTWSVLDRGQGLDETLAEASEAGEEVYDQLVQITRARISTAVAGTGLLPVWFTNALGPMPPNGTRYLPTARSSSSSTPSSTPCP